MKPDRYITGIFFLTIFMYPATGLAQYEQLYNPHSLRPVRKDDIMFKKSLWFRIDMRTKFNSAFFAQDTEISRILIKAVKNRQIIPYKSDSLETRMSIEEFLQKLTIPDPAIETLEFQQDTWNNETWIDNNNNKQETSIAEDNEFLPRQLYLIELKEDLIFDKRESRMKHDLLAITLIIPSEYSPAGIEKELASFSYKELVLNAVFKNNPEAIWYNSANSAEHRSLDEAFDLGLFRGRLVKYENPQNNMIVDMYSNNKRALQASEQVLYKLLEYEYLLWSY